VKERSMRSGQTDEGDNKNGDFISHVGEGGGIERWVLNGFQRVR
jgi:hypothetical protein